MMVARQATRDKKALARTFVPLALGYQTTCLSCPVTECSNYLEQLLSLVCTISGELYPWKFHFLLFWWVSCHQHKTDLEFIMQMLELNVFLEVLGA